MRVLRLSPPSAARQPTLLFFFFLSSLSSEIGNTFPFFDFHIFDKVLDRVTGYVLVFFFFVIFA